MTLTPQAPSSWQRLHPLTPIVRGGGIVVALLIVLAGSAGGRRSGGSVLPYDLAFVALVVVMSLIKWLVTRWKLDGVTLRIETGLLRRNSRQLPLARIQAVDVVRPFLARMLGLAELRIRLAGSNSASGRLAYLSGLLALDLRARLLASHHGLDLATPEPAEHALATVPTGRLVGSTLLSLATFTTVIAVAAIAALAQVSKPAAAATGGTTFVYILVLGRLTWRRVNEQYGFTVGQAADGIRIRRGLLGTIAETIPIQRVQAVRKIEPLLWRPFGWCRLEVDIAGSPGREQGTRSPSVTRSLLPVGPLDTAGVLLGTWLGLTGPALLRPPRRARWKAPLSYHFLAAGHDAALAAASTGRVRKVTTWVPLEKIQSIRRVQGPFQRRLGLASVHTDAAGRRVRAEFRDREVQEANNLLKELTELSRTARRRVTSQQSIASAPPSQHEVATPATDGSGQHTSPEGRYQDPSARHQYRY